MEDFKLFGDNSKTFKTLSEKETEDLLAENTKEAKDKLFEGSLGLVSFVLNKYFFRKSEEEKEELFQVGSLALWKTILNFDPKYNTKFSTYAVPTILGEIKRYLRDDHSIKRSRQEVDNNIKINNLIDEYKKTHSGGDLDSKTISKLLLMPIEEVENSMQVHNNVISIDEEVNLTGKDDKAPLSDFIEDGNNDFKYNEIINIIKQELEKLDERNKKIICLYFGLNCNKKNQIEIANELGVSQAQISRIIANFKDNLAKELGYDPRANAIKSKKKNVKKKLGSIYEELNIYDKQKIDKYLDNLEEEKKNLILMYFDNNLSSKASRQARAKARVAYKELVYNLALDYVREGEINMNNKNKIKDISELIDLIKTGKYDHKIKKFNIGQNNITINISLAECSIASINREKNTIEREKGLTKKCYIYEIIESDKTGKILDTIKIVKDKNMKKIYKYFEINDDKNIPLSKIDENELICYAIKNIQSIETEELEKNKKDNKPKITYTDYISNLYKEAILEYDQKDYKSSEEKFSKLVSMPTDNAILYESYKYLGYIYRKRKKFPLAEKYFREALTIQEDYYIFIELAKILREEGNYEEALKLFEKCDQFKNRKVIHLIEKAKTKSILKEYDEAIDILNKCITEKPYEYNAYFELANVLFEASRYIECLDIIDKCDEIRKGFNNHMVLKGKIAYLLGSPQEALKIFNKCVEQDKVNNVMYSIIEIGFFFHKLGSREYAYKYYRETPMFEKWENLSEEEIENHYKQHNTNKNNEMMHSIFNKDFSISELSEYIKDQKPTSVKQLYDIYQVHYPNIGMMIIDNGKIVQEDYITIHTLPFTKKIMMCYPDTRLEKDMINPPIEIVNLNKEDDNMNKENNENIKAKGIYKRFNEFTAIDINEAFSALPEKYQSIVLKYYGENLDSDPKRGLLTKEEQIILNKAIMFLNRRLTNKTNFYTKFKEIPHEEIDKVLNNSFNEKEINILKKFHNGDLSRPRLNGSLTKEETKQYKAIIRKLDNYFKQMQEIKPRLKTVKKSESETERIKPAMVVKEDKTDAFLSVHIDSEEEKELTTKTEIIKQQIQVEEAVVQVEKSTQEAEAPVEIPVEETKEEIFEEPVAKELLPVKEVVQETTVTKISNDDYTDILQYLNNPMFRKMTKNLPEKESVILSLLFGYVNGKYFSVDSISEFLDIEEIDILNMAKKALIEYKEEVSKMLDSAIQLFDNKNYVREKKPEENN